MSKNNSKSVSLETIAGRMYRADKSNNAALWQLAEFIAVQTASKVPQREIADRIQSTLTRTAPSGAPVIRISQGRVSQLLNGYKLFGNDPAARAYNPAVLYQYLGKNLPLSEFERVAAERAQKRSKRAMNNGGQASDEPGKGKGKGKADVTDAGLSAAHKALAKFAKSLDMSIEDAIWHLLEVNEKVVEEQGELNS